MTPFLKRRSLIMCTLVTLFCNHAVARTAAENAAEAARVQAFKDSFKALGISDDDYKSALTLIKATVRTQNAYSAALSQLNQAIKSSGTYKSSDSATKEYEFLKKYASDLTVGVTPIQNFVQYYSTHKQGKDEYTDWRSVFDTPCDRIESGTNILATATAMGVDLSKIPPKTIALLKEGNTSQDLCETLRGKYTITDTKNIAPKGKSIINALKDLSKSQTALVAIEQNAYDSLAIYAGDKPFSWPNN